ncbi:MAG TPA: hypothetical protein VN709_08340 [Terriglobales bacterium]|nr:hypothetical protein [Terriglobales bacterium]
MPEIRSSLRVPASRNWATLTLAITRQKYTLLIGLLAGLALVLAFLGIYVLMLFRGTAARVVGVRAALGARPAQLRWLVGRRCWHRVGA